MATILKSKKYLALLLLLLLLVISLPFLRKQEQFISEAGVVWTTEYHLTYECRRSLNDSVQAILNAIDMSASPYNKQSLVSAVNGNRATTADDYFIKLYTTAREVNAASGGLYDPTVMPLVNAWGFGYKSGNLPGKAQVDSILAFVGISHTRLDGSRIIKDDPRVQFDFSSIAKGLACDEIAAMMRRNGSLNALVEIGGEVVAAGANPQGKPWQVSVDMPVAAETGAEHASAMVVELSDCAIATSGSYRKYKDIGGKKVSHIVNPLTGDAQESNLLSVSIIAKDCMTADAWATACMAMGLSKTQELLQNNAALSVMTISTNDDGDFVVWSNKRFADAVRTE